jgi:hypothetical protein
LQKIVLREHLWFFRESMIPIHSRHFACTEGTSSGRPAGKAFLTGTARGKDADDG